MSPWRQNPRDIYDITKLAGEELCRDFFEKENIQATVLRVGRCLPEDENLLLNHRLYRGLDERDGAEVLRLALEHDFASFEKFNISSGQQISIKNPPGENRGMSCDHLNMSISAFLKLGKMVSYMNLLLSGMSLDSVASR